MRSMAVCLAAMVLPAIAESQAVEAPPAFEVASVKLSGPADSVLGMFTYPGGRVTASNTTAQTLIEQAFDVEAFQISGGPQWMRELRFNIDAKPPASSKSSKSNPSSIKLPPNDEQRQMLQSLLMERFQLKFTRTTKEGAIYRLVKNGKELHLKPAKDPNEFPWVGGPRGAAIMGDGIAGQTASMALLAKRLGQYVGRPVVDQTGIEGAFDFRYDYAAGDQKRDVAATIFTSLEGIGLKLEPARGPFETIEITSIAKPSEN